MGPLHGRRVVVTRAAEQADALALPLEELGAEVVRLPLIATVGPSDGGAAFDDAMRRLDSFDWVVVTSPNGAARVAPHLAGLGDGAPRPRVAAVGRATEAALGCAADLVPTDQIAEGLLAEFPAGSGRVLLTVAEQTRGVLHDGLTATGWHVEQVAAYRTAIAPIEMMSDAAWRAARERIAGADAVVFTSGSAVRGWVAAVRSWNPAIMVDMTVAIGPETARVAQQESLKITHVAADHSLAGVMAEIVGALGDFPPDMRRDQG